MTLVFTLNPLIWPRSWIGGISANVLIISKVTKIVENILFFKLSTSFLSLFNFNNSTVIIEMKYDCFRCPTAILRQFQQILSVDSRTTGSMDRLYRLIPLKIEGYIMEIYLYKVIIVPPYYRWLGHES